MIPAAPKQSGDARGISSIKPINSAEMWSEDAWRLAMSTTRNEEWPVPAPWGQEPWRAARIAKRELPSRLTYYRGHNTKAPRGGNTKSFKTTYRRGFWIVRAANDPAMVA